ncbi:MAG: class I SAM-dependent methyltransferase [Dehalococcoidia bacterium]|nr:class I SAM-dependent methyltransferase [Dehalococcoidia bacterium]
MVKTLADEFVGYENLIRFVEERALQNSPGDIVEVGAYMGGGTAKLAEFAQRYAKKVFAIDTFDASLDETMSPQGVKAGEVYQAFLYGESMLKVYQETTRGFDNIITIKADSRTVKFPEDQEFIFGFVDGCHQEEYVENDFHLIWPNLVSGGVLGFHDYRFDDWPGVTKAVDRLIETYKNEISETHQIEAGYGILSIMLIKK